MVAAPAFTVIELEQSLINLIGQLKICPVVSSGDVHLYGKFIDHPAESLVVAVIANGSAPIVILPVYAAGTEDSMTQLLILLHEDGLLMNISSDHPLAISTDPEF